MSSTFAPVFAGTQANAFARHQQQREHKRRRLHKDADDSDESDNKERLHKLAGTGSTTHHPVKQTDPYHVAGLPREIDLPPPPFPHAPVARESATTLDVGAELASLNPPLFSKKGTTEDHASHLKRLHAGNMTAIMHTSMLDGDWNRASRAWGLLLRTEIGGKGPALRQNGTWNVGAELLMRRAHNSYRSGLALEDEGFNLVRRYYERLVLQYPKTARVKAKVTALSIYPAMFNVWIYGVQHLSKRDQKEIDAERASTPRGGEATYETRSDERSRRLLEIKMKEAEGATAIIRRMDDLMNGPPYDDNGQLLLLRGMCGLWLADLQEQISQSTPYADTFDQTDSGLLGDEKRKAQEILRKAQHILRKQKESSDVLPTSIQLLLNEWNGSEVM